MAAGQVFRPFVYENGKQRLLAPGEQLQSDSEVCQMTAASSITGGQAVSNTANANEVDLTDCLAQASWCAYMGIACERAGPGDTLGVVTHGKVTLTTAEWDAVTGGTGGLVAGDTYYVDATTGNLTNTPPASTATPKGLVAVGVATSDDTLMVNYADPYGI